MLETPNTTVAQIVSLVGAVVGLLVAFAILDEAASQAIVAAASVIVPSVYMLADSIIRNGRARGDSQR